MLCSFKKDPNQRPSAKQMLDHKWLQDAKSTQSDTDGAKRIIKEYTIRKANMVSMRKTLKDIFNNTGNNNGAAGAAAGAGGPASPRGKGAAAAAAAAAAGGPASPRGKVSLEDDGAYHRPRKSVMGTLSNILNASTGGNDQKSGRHLVLDGGLSHKLPTALQAR